MKFNILILLLTIVNAREDPIIIDIIAPPLRINPRQSEDVRLCYAISLPEDETFYAIKFEPTAGAFVAHHLTLHSCSPGYSSDRVWACGTEPYKLTEYESGPVCSGGTSNIIFVWAKDADGIEIPDGAGFVLKRGTNLVLNIHYKNLSELNTDLTPGIRVTATKTKPSNEAFIFEMFMQRNAIAPGATAFWDIVCTVSGHTIHPFAYRVHTHHLGKAVLGYHIDHVNKKWTKLAGMDPNLPEAFYLIESHEKIEINSGDFLTARCIMYNDLDHTVSTGVNDSDEMCILYIMYYVVADEGRMQLCSNVDNEGRWSDHFNNVPEDANSYNETTYLEYNP